MRVSIRESESPRLCFDSRSLMRTSTARTGSSAGDREIPNRRKRSSPNFRLSGTAADSSSRGQREAIASRRSTQIAPANCERSNRPHRRERWTEDDRGKNSIPKLRRLHPKESSGRKQGCSDAPERPIESPIRPMYARKPASARKSDLTGERQSVRFVIFVAVDTFSLVPA
jgi:hypothetical protein